MLAVASFEEAARMLQDNAYDCITLDLSLGEHSCVYRKLDSAILVVKATENWV